MFELHDDISFSECSQQDGASLTPCSKTKELLKKLEIPVGSKRYSEFLIGRQAAKRALGGEYFIGKAQTGEPIWPDGLIGSISHTEGLAVAAVGSSEKFQAIGIDLENIDRKINIDISKRICSDSEKQWLDTKEDLLKVFSSKEAIYKALFPICKTFFGFLDVELRPAGGGYTAQLNRALSSDLPEKFEFEVNFKKKDKHLLTYVILE